METFSGIELSILCACAATASLLYVLAFYRLSQDDRIWTNLSVAIAALCTSAPIFIKLLPYYLQ